jgi:acyl-coenzyme A thioesterase PaaI-like protein
MAFHPPPGPPTVPFHALSGIEILDAEPGFGRARIPDRPDLRNHFGTVHGGALFSVGEVAAASGMTRLLGADLSRLRAITRRGAIDYLKPARGAISGAAIIGMSAADIAASLSRSDSLSVPVSVELADDAGLVVARLNVDWFVGKRREVGDPTAAVGPSGRR